MFKYVFAVALLSSVALGFESGFVREWTNAREWDADAKAYCVDECKLYCGNCTEPKRCDPLTEKWCDYKPIDPDMSQCSPDDICVPIECECDYEVSGIQCERICKVECTEEQVICGQTLTATGCKQNDKCVHKGFDFNGKLCKGNCPVECGDDELFCPQPNTVDGCKKPEECVKKQKDHEDNICAHQQCPLECTKKEQLCGGSVDKWGCKEDDVCEPRKTSDQNELCPGTCPVECQNGEILCDGTIDYSDTNLKGCKGQDICHVKAKNENGVNCPLESGSQLCPKLCPPGEVLCEPSEGPLGCKGQKECETRSTNEKDEFCPSTSDCPTHCSTNQYNCANGVDESGCKLPEECVDKERGFDGELCPFHCPEICNEQQLFCLGGIDETGCRRSSSCRDKEEHRWGPGAETEPKEECPGYCSYFCETHEILCPSQLDPCNGCTIEELCREAIKNKEGIFCAGKELAGKDSQDTSLRKGGYLSYSHNCPKLCKEEDGEVLCPTYEDESGCKPEAECKMRVKDVNEDWCPSYSVCEKQCAKGYKLCVYESVNSKECKVEPSCVYKGKNKNDLYCAGHCPPICSAGELLVSSGFDAENCELPSVCEVVV